MPVLHMVREDLGALQMHLLAFKVHPAPHFLLNLAEVSLLVVATVRRIDQPTVVWSLLDGLEEVELVFTEPDAKTAPPVVWSYTTES